MTIFALQHIAASPAILSALATTCDSPSVRLAAVDPTLLKTGQQQFLVCGACHGQNGEGTAAGPPLAGSERVTGPEQNLIRIQLRGLQGPIKVKGQEYNFPGGMAALAYQTDGQIAAELTAPVAEPKPQPTAVSKAGAGKYAHLAPPSSRPRWIAAAALIGILGIFIAALRKNQN